MTNMRNEIAEILKTQLMLSTHDERDIPDAADAIIELVQARIDKLEDALDWFAKGYFINEFASGQEMAERIVRRAQGALKGSDT